MNKNKRKSNENLDEIQNYLRIELFKMEIEKYFCKHSLSIM